MKSLMSPIPTSSATQMMSQKTSTAATSSSGTVTVTSFSASTDSPSTSASRRVQQQQLQQQLQQATMKAATTTTTTQTSLQASALAKQEVNSSCSDAGAGTAVASAAAAAAGGNNTPIASSPDTNGVVIKTEEKDCDDNGSLASSSTSTTMGDGVATDNEAISNESFIHARPRPILLSAVNPHITCNLCHGYLIDATTIVECLHSFCHSCLIKHLRTEKYCPRCEMMINTAKPNIKPDTTLQAIVYKLVPGLYEKELMRKRAFYKDRPAEAALATPEQRGEDTEQLIFGPTDNMSLSLEYADIEELIGSGANGREFSELRKPRYLQCPAMYTVAHLKKFVHGKFSIDSHRFGIDIMYKVKTIILLDHYTLMDVAYIYTWKRDAPMRFYFRVKESAAALRRFQQNRLRRSVAQVKREPSEEQQRQAKSSYSGPMTIVHVASGNPATAAAKESTSAPSLTEIKKEKDDEAEQQQQATSKAPVAGHRPKSSKPSSSELKHFSVVPYNGGANASSTPKAGDLKITLVSKQSPKEAGLAVKTPIYATAAQMSNSLSSKNQDPYAFETNNNVAASAAAASNQKDRKVENIKLKIDLSRQNSVTIINSCSPSSGGGKRKDSSKDKDKEWKVKTSKKDKDKDYGKAAGGKSSSYLTVPPLTIKAERINSSSASAKSPSLGKNQGSPKTRSSAPSRVSPPALSPPEPRTEEEKKSLFLKSVALVPISKGTSPQEGAKTPSPPKSPSSSVAPPPLFKIPASVPVPSKSSHASLGGSSASKRKNSEPMKAPVAAKKAKPSSPTLPNYNMDFKIRLPARPFTSLASSSASPALTSSTTTTTATSTGANQTTTTASAFSSPAPKDKPLMPPPSAPAGSMKPPQAPSTSNAAWSRPKSLKNAGQNQRVAGGLPGLTPLSPHPLFGGNAASSSLGGNGLVQPSPPGNRTPIAKRYQPILPKAARPNPFANIPCDVNQILKNAGTEIKTINEPKSLTPILPKVYGPKGDANTHSPQQQQQQSQQQQQQQQQRVMGPPKAPAAKMPTKGPANSSPGNNQQRGTTAKHNTSGGHTPSTIASNNSNNYRNLALYNSSKSRGNDAPPGYRTPIYTPNSPIYSPSSPQYSPNFSIPTVPMYKYTPKPSNTPTSSPSSSSTSSSSSSPSGTGSNSSGGGTSYLQSILSTNPSMANLFPSPPVQKDSPKSNSPPVASDLSAGNNHNNNKGPTHHQQQTQQQQQQQHQSTAPKRVYPFARSPSPCGSSADEPADKQSMKSLLNSCNINIPSSLSITITREDSESPSNSGSYPKRKSPVNNYIEILKLPDQQVAPAAASGTGAANEPADTKRSSPPMQKVGALLGQPQSISMLATRDKAEEKQPSPPTGGTSVTSQQQQQQQQQVARKAVPVSTATMPMAPPASGPSMMLNGGTAGKQQQQQQKKPQQQQHQATSTPPGAGKLTTGTMATTPAAGHFNKASSPVTNNNNSNNNGNGNSGGMNVVKASAKSPTATTTTTTTTTPSTSPTGNTPPQQQSNAQTGEKRTPSPEKKAGASGNTPGGNKSPNEQPGAKKFRPILPRQIPTPIPEVIPPKVTSANIIGTYSSPSGVAVKVHAHKKLPIPKVSPTGATSNNTTTTSSSNATTAQQQQHSPNGSSKPQNLVPASASSPPVKGSTGVNLTTSSAAATPNSGTPPTVTAAASKAKARISKAATPPPTIASSATFTKPSGSPPNTVSSKFMPPPPSPLSVMPPPSMPPPSLTAAAAAQANDLSKLYRVQQAVAAAAAAQNPSNMLYSYAAAAAQMGLQFPGANLFGYPQALLMGQLSRMQRPGNEVLGEFMMQKLKGPNGDLGGPMSLPLSPPLSGGLPALPPALPAASAKKSEAAANNNSAKANNKNTKATAATNGVPTSIATSKAK